MRARAVRSVLSVSTALSALSASSAFSQSPPRLTTQTSGTTALLQAVSIVDDQTAWVSGHKATWAHTADGGLTWIIGTVPGADSLQFRDVYAVSEDTAFLMAAGPGALSRIYHTIDGGLTWQLQWTNPDPKGFYDCFAFWDPTHGILFGDQVDGQTIMLQTTDGTLWNALPPSRLPAPSGTEGGFAASGTCIITLGDHDAWVATGAGDSARVFHTTDRGEKWTAVTTPIPAGPTAGLATIAFRDEKNGVALGGDVAKEGVRSDNVVVTTDGGKKWSVAGRPSFAGGVYGAAYATGVKPAVLVAVGPGGMSLSRDDGRSWVALDTLAYWSVGFGRGTSGYAVGPKGRITRIDLGP
jgi:photosystem II stability/assembly factor-like uncharacterized protein